MPVHRAWNVTQPFISALAKPLNIAEFLWVPIWVLRRPPVLKAAPAKELTFNTHVCLSSKEHFKDTASFLHQQPPNLKHLFLHQISGEDIFLHANTTSQK